MKRLCFTSLLIIFSVGVFLEPCVAGWLIFHKPEFRGKILDAETKQPIEGAVIAAIYQTHSIIGGPGGGSSSIIHVKEALTDKEGEFLIPSYVTVIQPNSTSWWTEFIIYKPGYGSYPNQKVYPFTHCGPEYLFSKEFGSKGEVRRGSEVLQVVFGFVELPRLNTWDERQNANRVYMSNIPKSEWPLLQKRINEEDEWLRNNKGWRR
jgi:hypothetical protein